MNEALSPSQHVFVVRIWLETDDLALAQWRGAVEHVSSGQRFYFTSLGDLSDFIAVRLGQGGYIFPLEKGRT
jgi:hypothetical protein